MLFIILHIIYRKLITIFTNVKRQKNYCVKANVTTHILILIIRSIYLLVLFFVIHRKNNHFQNNQIFIITQVSQK